MQSTREGATTTFPLPLAVEVPKSVRLSNRSSISSTVSDDALDASFISRVSSIGHSSIWSEDVDCDGDIRSLSSASVEEEEEEEAVVDPEKLRRAILIHGPSRANRAHDYKSIQAERQTRLDNLIVSYAKEALASRHDHHLMVRQLISHAYWNDPNRVANRGKWKGILAAVGKEFWGARAIFSLSPDPYHTVVSKLSAMGIWDEKVRHWKYGSIDENARQRNAKEVLAQLQQSGQLFL